MTESTDQIVLEARNITKRYPGTLALNGVTFRVHRNQVNVLIGENGAGKSTLMRILAGVETADSVNCCLMEFLFVCVHRVKLRSKGYPSCIRNFPCFPILISVKILCRSRTGKGRILLNRKTEVIRAAKARTSPQADAVRTTVHNYRSAAARLWKLRVRSIKEPKFSFWTSQLQRYQLTETESLFQVIEDLKRSGVTIIYISHRLHELLHLGDWFTVLRSGRVVGDAHRSEVSRQWIVERMSGRAVSRPDRAVFRVGKLPVLDVEGLTLAPRLRDEAAQAPLHDVSLTLCRGEILGIYGLLGAGRTELLESLAGARHLFAGTVRLNQKDASLPVSRTLPGMVLCLCPKTANEMA